MQCMMKEVCAQCLQKHVDPETGRETIIFSCFNQDQELDRVDFPNLAARLRQNTVQEKLSNLWFDHLVARRGRWSTCRRVRAPSGAQVAVHERLRGEQRGTEQAGLGVEDDLHRHSLDVASIGALSRNACMKRPSVSAQNLGRDAAADEQASSRNRSQHQVPGLRAVSVHEHSSASMQPAHRRSSAATGQRRGASRRRGRFLQRTAPRCIARCRLGSPRPETTCSTSARPERSISVGAP